MRAVVDPGAAHLHPFAGGDGGGMADDGDQVPLAACLDAQHAEPALLVVVGHALDKPSQGLGGTGLRSLWIGWKRHSVGKLWHDRSDRGANAPKLKLRALLAPTAR